MADMPQNSFPRRPSPPGRTRSRSSSPNRPALNRPTPVTPTGETFLRPPNPVDDHGDIEPLPNGQGSASNGEARQGRPPAVRVEDGEEISLDEDIDLSDDEGDDLDVDYYAVLNLPRSASDHDIKAAYHALCLRVHPDKQSPHLRKRATKYFNQIVIAYETLINHNKRVVYDRLGHEGLRGCMWQLGPRALSEAELKERLDDLIRKRRAEKLEFLVQNRGSLQIKSDVSGMWYPGLEVYRDKKTGKQKQRIAMFPPYVSQISAKHSFDVPLQALGELLDRPLKELWEGGDEKKKKTQNTPRLELNTGVSGAYVKRKLIGQPTISAKFSHLFAGTESGGSRSINTILAGNEISTTVHAFPNPKIAFSVARAVFGNFRLQSTCTVARNPLLAPPTFRLDVSRRLGFRHSFILALGLEPRRYPSTIFSLSGFDAIDRLGFASLGYTYLPMAIAAPELDSESSPESLKRKAKKRSERTETYGIFLTGGFLADVAQVKLNWGRTFFVGTPLGAAQRKTFPQGAGIRLESELTCPLLGQMSYSAAVTRRVFENTSMGFNVSVGGLSGLDGVSIGLTWSRLGQKLSFPVALAPFNANKAIFYGAGIPMLLYAGLELLLLRPRADRIQKEEQKQLRKKTRARMLRGKKRALDLQELMAESVANKMEAERQHDGLVIQKATYGPRTRGDMSPRKADVTIPLAALVERGQLNLPRGINKSHIVGFWDPAPGEEKIIEVEYLFVGMKHSVIVKESQGLVLPVRSHAENSSV